MHHFVYCLGFIDSTLSAAVVIAAAPQASRFGPFLAFKRSLHVSPVFPALRSRSFCYILTVRKYDFVEAQLLNAPRMHS